MKEPIKSERMDGMNKTPEEVWAEFCAWYLSEVEKFTVNYLEEKQKFATRGKSPMATIKEDCDQ